MVNSLVSEKSSPCVGGVGRRVQFYCAGHHIASFIEFAMSFPKKGKSFPKKGKSFPKRVEAGSLNFSLDDHAFAIKIALALKLELKDRNSRAKLVAGWTGANERTVKN
jgi:hypothetical protein